MIPEPIRKYAEQLANNGLYSIITEDDLKRSRDTAISKIQEYRQLKTYFEDYKKEMEEVAEWLKQNL